ncbi:hypothetical protein U0070_024344 [Myodes glareolus]|uniref:Uncharacterized protein n=1 Tax=Myodes glareolus TaxID=447135 RepID=A0AAW0ILF1_MYOGA
MCPNMMMGCPGRLAESDKDGRESLQRHAAGGVRRVMKFYPADDLFSYDLSLAWVSGLGWRAANQLHPGLEIAKQKNEENEKGNKDCEGCDHPLIQGDGSNESLPRPVGQGLNEDAIQPDSLNVAGFSELKTKETHEDNG